MKDIIKWLRNIEHLANQVYLKAATIYADDIKLKKFLDHTAEEEAWHYHVMGSAAEYLSSISEIIPIISIDQQTSDKITGLLNYIDNGLELKIISRDELINKIVELELSEWNDIFLYTVNLLKEKTSEFKYPAAKIQSHIKEIEYYLETTEGRPQDLQKIKELQPIWVENILIVDDEEMITDLISSLIDRSGNIDVAHNGQDALKKMGEKYYKLVISDVDMPIMDGIEFYKKTIEKYPSSANKFLFITGYLSPEKEAFFKENQVRYLSKPMDISVIRDIASQIIVSA